MAALKVGVREFRERIASFLESDTPVAVTRRGETLVCMFQRAGDGARQRRFPNRVPRLIPSLRRCQLSMTEWRTRALKNGSRRARQCW